ncbi:unnamed protein product, partial [Vitis vinifera]|uniref:Uncharacterized protein n=1 Tax=Vitis vinifera TaxID=29760 RepID=D7TIW3_VITVI
MPKLDEDYHGSNPILVVSFLCIYIIYITGLILV